MFHCRNDNAISRGMDGKIGSVENPTTRREYYAFEAQLVDVVNGYLYNVLS